MSEEAVFVSARRRNHMEFLVEFEGQRSGRNGGF